jgi:hypothetical protein
MGTTLPLSMRGSSVDAGKQLQELSAKLQSVGHDGLLRKLRRNIRAAGIPVVTDLHRAVLSVDVTPHRKGGVPSNSHLRERVADALTTSVTARRVRITINAAKVGPYGTSLPKYLDGSIPRYRRWRHMVWGHKDRWSEQTGQPWFFRTVSQHSSDFRRAVLAAMDETARELKE